MPAIRFTALPDDVARHYWSGGADAYGQEPERKISDGHDVPCRYGLTELPAGAPYLIVAHRPFKTLQPYAETGPIFLSAEPIQRFEGEGVPEMYLRWSTLLMRGYSADERIIYGTGRIIETEALEDACTELLERPDIAFIHLRSAANNCFQCRVERAA